MSEKKTNLQNKIAECMLQGSSLPWPQDNDTENVAHHNVMPEAKSPVAKMKIYRVPRSACKIYKYYGSSRAGQPVVVEDLNSLAASTKPIWD